MTFTEYKKVMCALSLEELLKIADEKRFKLQNQTDIKRVRNIIYNKLQGL